MQINLYDRRTARAFADYIETCQTVSVRSVMALLQWPVFVAYLMGTKQ